MSTTKWLPKITGQVFLFIVLTALTQIGGIIFLLCIPFFKIFNKIDSNITRFFAKVLSFSLVYLISSFFIIPPIASNFGRVPLPLIQQEAPLKPLNIFTCIFNRHYVTPTTKKVLVSSALKFGEEYPKSTIKYLDANFPFWNKFPLLPHLSHNDGKKVDLAFFYLRNSTKEQSNKTPSFIGYGVYVEPYENEYNTTADCKKKGYWQYDILGKIIPQNKVDELIFDEKRTRHLIKILCQNNQIEKIFIEPHLKSRLLLSKYSKIRFHGCHAVRHDDHIHLQTN
jgi:hypothetical protein